VSPLNYVHTKILVIVPKEERSFCYYFEALVRKIAQAGQ